jgi:mono/diheme cytochrome c family protein
MRRIATTLLSSLIVVTLANPAALADAANGEKLARRWCASCHVVATDQRQGNTQADPFSAMAKLPGLDAGKLALYLLLPHPKMPDMNLSRSEAADLAAYIAKQGR